MLTTWNYIFLMTIKRFLHKSTILRNQTEIHHILDLRNI